MYAIVRNSSRSSDLPITIRLVLIVDVSKRLSTMFIERGRQCHRENDTENYASREECFHVSLFGQKEGELDRGNKNTHKAALYTALIRPKPRSGRLKSKHLLD